MEQSFLKLQNITKKYPGVTALNGVSVEFQEGEVHALVGENGAGKSTFIKAITGAIDVDEGQIIYQGQQLEDNNPIKSQEIGITAIYQEFNLIPYLTIAENVFFGNELKRGLRVDYKSMREKTIEILKELGIRLNPDRLVKDISVSYQQIVEIAKALSKNVRVLIMDEPSAALGKSEIKYMFEIIKKLRARGVTIIYISHKLEEIFEVADRVTVMRDGQKIKTLPVSRTDRKQLIKLMVGRELGQEFPDRQQNYGSTILQVNNLSNNKIKGISFKLKEGEILGCSGLVGSGRTEMARAIFGADRLESGEIVLDEQRVVIDSPEAAIRKGIALITEDRKQEGLLLEMDVKDNICFPCLQDLSSLGMIDFTRVYQESEKMKRELNIKTPSLKQTVKNLSGGNQQKVVLAKWLLSDCEVLIFDEPTRGIDVGAKQEIYHLIHRLAGAGKGIIIISSDMPEILGMADRIMVMYEGRKMGELQGDIATQEQIMEMASGKMKEELI